MKTALITGISGQDGSYLAELLLSKNYKVHGLIRRNSNYEVIPNISHIRDQIKLHYGDLTDNLNIRNIIEEVKPDEVYNLAAQSHVHVSFEVPEYTADTDALGVLRLLEAIKQYKSIKFYQASTSELFGLVQTIPQNEKTPFYPRSPYGVSKLFGHWITINYRESYNLFASTGILYNHESPRRGEAFVTRKITKGFRDILTGKQSSIKLGNIDAQRDWGHARDFVEGIWMILQHNEPDDFILATGKQYSVREFCNLTAEWHGMNLEWEGHDFNERGIDRKTGKVLIEIDPKFYRPADVNTLLGDYSKAKQVLGWEPKMNLNDIVHDMCSTEMKRSHNEY
jgi:GDPmannose 4,6-dehydratase